LFYLKDDIRSRLVEEEGRYKVQDTTLEFTVEELKHELVEHPERFSPNVILRGMFQETILPNIAFIWWRWGAGLLARVKGFVSILQCSVSCIGIAKFISAGRKENGGRRPIS
jgi:uncharacterized protein YllA (UPF0747 family)